MNIESEIRRLQRQVNQLTRMVEQLQKQQEQEYKNNLMTVTEFAKVVGCSRSTVVNRIKKGIYGAERHGKTWFLPSPDYIRRSQTNIADTI